jgi:Family of unknown function (DUF6166)/Flavoprotein/Helix-turn-helix domain
MTEPDRDNRDILYLVVCAAPPARNIRDFILLAKAALWDVYVFVTPQSIAFINVLQITQLTGHPVRSEYEFLEELDTLPEADAIVVVPATFATINQWTQGTGETLALNVLYQGSRQATPIVVVPYIQPQLALHPALLKSLVQLSQWRVRVLYQPQASLTSNTISWESILDELHQIRGDQHRPSVAIELDSFTELIPTAVAAERYNLSPSYVARLARTGLIQARKFGKSWVVEEAALRRYIAQPKKPGPRPRTWKLYQGWREKDVVGHESTHVTVNGSPLPPFNTHGPRPPKSVRFEWGYYGGGPSELAVAILADYFGEDSPRGWVNRQASQAMKYADAFKSAFIGKLPRDSWVLASEQIHEWLEKQNELEIQTTAEQAEGACSSETP